ncbi:hypothetical protein Pcinc_006491 [Petrolisthes cinctipes]|uniref:CCHC-type domain-containing protein n=1 Tax=Petrolisthes cinctipes TaxID=88211 RepID=A0AAE1GD25_PETCI|nr:hypothetical protein Pcinc_006491 [Petrolisthes cinctipes]
MAATTSPRCFRCQTWGHDKADCAALGPSSLHSLSTLGRRLCQTPLLCRAVGRFKKPLSGCLPSGDVGGVGVRRPPPPLWYPDCRSCDVLCGDLGCSVGTQAAAPRSGGVATQTPSPPTPEMAPPPPPAAGGESSPPSSNQATQPDGETPKDLDLDEAFLVQPKKKKKKASPTAPTTQRTSHGQPPKDGFVYLAKAAGVLVIAEAKEAEPPPANSQSGARFPRHPAR